MTKFSFVNMPVDRKWIALAVVSLLVIGSVMYLIYNSPLATNFLIVRNSRNVLAKVSKRW